VSENALNNQGFQALTRPPRIAYEHPVSATSEHNALNSPANPFPPPIRIVATRRRRRTVAARLRAGVLELLVPDWMSQAERHKWAEVMSRRLQKRVERSKPSDERLAGRASELNERHFGGRLRWRSIVFADMSHLWGSCTFTSGAIRIAARAAALPAWVLDYLLVHELAHLEHSDHGPAFRELENRYPLSERARGYLMALDHAAGEGVVD